METNNIILIGMPGSGKTTIGKRLSEVTNKKFLDFDVLLEEKYKMGITALLRGHSDNNYLQMEEETAKEIQTENTVIALSGSAATLDGAMEYMKTLGKVIYIKAPFEIIESRLSRMDLDRVIGIETMSLQEIYTKRDAKYSEFADYTFENTTLKNTLGIFTDFYNFYKKTIVGNATGSSTLTVHF